MKKLWFAALTALAVVTAGCVKQAQETVVKNDGSATVKLSMGIKKEVFENLKAMIEAQMGGGEDEADGQGAGVSKALDQMITGLDDKKIAEEWKKMGIEVGKSSTVDKDGWKTVELEGVIKNFAEYSKKYAERQKALQEKVTNNHNPAEMMSSFTKQMLPAAPHFYKTDKADVAKIAIAAGLGDMFDKMDQGPLGKLDEMDDEQKQAMEDQMNQLRAMFALDEMKSETKLTLPGKVLSVSGLKQEGENTVIFSVLGKSLGLDSIKDLASAAKNGMTATVQIDPKEFKIALEDEPKAESKPVEKKAAKPAKKDEEEKKTGENDK